MAESFARAESYARQALARDDGVAEAVDDELVARKREGYVSPTAFATVHLGLGNQERALDFIEEGFRERRGWMAYLMVNPVADAVRGHPRFAALVEKMKL